MKVQFNSAQNSVLSKNQKKNKPAFGMNLKMTMPVYGATNDAQKIVLRNFANKIMRDGRNETLMIHQYDNTVVGELTNRRGKSIAQHIHCGPDVNPENYFKVPEIVKGIYANAAAILDKVKK